MQQYTVTYGGTEITMQLDDQDAARMGLLKTPDNKQAPALITRAAAPRNKKGTASGKPSAARIK